MAVVNGLAKGQLAGLADQAHVPSLGLDRAGKSQIVGGRKVAGIDEHDPIQVQCRRDAHRAPLFSLTTTSWADVGGSQVLARSPQEQAARSAMSVAGRGSARNAAGTKHQIDDREVI
jgi:hypothetical protein